MTEYGFDTLAIHAGAKPDPTTGARATPIYPDDLLRLRGCRPCGLALRPAGLRQHLYAHHQSDDRRARRARRGARRRHGGARRRVGPRRADDRLPHADVAGRSFRRRQAALWRLDQPVRAFLRQVRLACRLGRHATIRPMSGKPSARRRRPIFIESLANPGGIVIDIAAIAKIAHEAGVPLIVDNTLASPYLIRPIEHGADIVVHSATKFLGGHGNSMGGIIVDAGKFDWSKDDKYPDAVGALPLLSRPRNPQDLRQRSPSPSPAACSACAISVPPSRPSMPS